MYGICACVHVWYVCVCTHVGTRNQTDATRLAGQLLYLESSSCWITVEGHLHNVQVFLGLCELVKTLSWGQVQSGVWVSIRA